MTCVSLVLSLSEMWRSTIVAEWPAATPDATALLMHACRRSTAPASVSRLASLFSRRTRMLTCGEGGWRLEGVRREVEGRSKGDLRGGGETAVCVCTMKIVVSK